MDKAEKIWMDGKFNDWDNAKIHILNQTTHYGAGVFEGIRCYSTKNGPAVFRLKEHIDRLFNSAETMLLEIPCSKDEIIKAVKETVRVNKLESAYIRPLVYLGYGEMGLNIKKSPVRVSIAAFPWGKYLGEEGMLKGIKVKISKYKRAIDPITNAKICGNYVKSILAKMDALNTDYEEAILLDEHDNVAEGSGENIFIVEKGILRTPRLSAVLPGITRASVFEIASSLHLECKEDDISKEELLKADEVFLTGTAAEITPVSYIDDNVIGEGQTGPITKQIQDKFFKIVAGEDKKFENWLDYI